MDDGLHMDLQRLFGGGMGISYLWWHRNIRFAENGIVIRREFVEWRWCIRWYWDASYRHVVVLEFLQRARIAAIVGTDERERVAALLRKKIEFEDNPESIRPAEGGFS